MNPFRTSLLSFLGGLSVYFGALVGLLVLDNSLSGAWLLPGGLLLFGGLLLAIDLLRELRKSAKATASTADKRMPLPQDHSYAMSLATRSSYLPRPR